MRFASPKSRRPRVDISPLIDVVFQLLLFYAVTTQFVTPERLKLALPEARTAESSRGTKAEEAEVLVTAEGNFFVAGTKVQEQALERAIKRLVTANPQGSLTIRGDKGAPYGAVIRALDAARAAGAKAINLVAIKPGNTPPQSRP